MSRKYETNRKIGDDSRTRSDNDESLSKTQSIFSNKCTSDTAVRTPVKYSVQSSIHLCVFSPVHTGDKVEFNTVDFVE